MYCFDYWNMSDDLLVRFLGQNKNDRTEIQETEKQIHQEIP